MLAHTDRIWCGIDKGAKNRASRDKEIFHRKGFFSPEERFR
jgi:hypothetical protein